MTCKGVCENGEQTCCHRGFENREIRQFIDTGFSFRSDGSFLELEEIVVYYCECTSRPPNSSIMKWFILCYVNFISKHDSKEKHMTLKHSNWNRYSSDDAAWDAQIPHGSVRVQVSTRLPIQLPASRHLGRTKWWFKYLSPTQETRTESLALSFNLSTVPVIAGIWEGGEWSSRWGSQSARLSLCLCLSNK